MRIDLANDIKTGDTLYNCFMDPVVVTSIYKDNNNIIFSTIDTKLYRRGYSYEDIYFSDLYGESDEEKSWINWIKNNRDILDTIDIKFDMELTYEQLGTINHTNRVKTHQPTNIKKIKKSIKREMDRFND